MYTFLDIEVIDGRLVFVRGFPPVLKNRGSPANECTSRHTIGGCRVFPVYNRKSRCHSWSSSGLYNRRRTAYAQSTICCIDDCVGIQE